MKKLIILLTFLFYLSNSYSQKLELLIISPSEKISLGETVKLQLRINNLNKIPIIIEDDFDLFSYHNFIYDFEITPRTEGKVLLGPYSIELNNKKLTSNSIEIKVKDKELRENRIELKAQNKCKVKETITLELISLKAPIDNIEIVENSKFKIIGTSQSSSTSIRNGEVSNRYVTSIRIEFIQSGEYIIDGTWFNNIPNYYSINEIKLKVD